MSTGTVSYAISKNITPSTNVSTNTGGGILITSDSTYSIPSGCTYSRVKVTKASTNSSLQFSWRTSQVYGETSWNTWYSSSSVGKSKFVNPDSNKPQIYVKNKGSSYINTTFTITVEYTYPNKTITVSAGAGGTATANVSSAGYGDTVTLTATANTGYSFSKWTTTGGTLANANSASTTLTMPNANVTVTASFTHIQRTLTTASDPAAGGTTTGGGTKYYNDSCSISATANTGYAFSNWTTTGGTLANANSASTTLTMPNANATVTAHFTHVERTLTTASNPADGGTTTGGGTKYYNDSCSISATANTGYTFSNWVTTGGTLADANSASTTLTMPNADATVTANFTHNLYNITGNVSPSGGGDISLSSTTGYYNDEITLSASPSDGYQFSSWSTSPSVTITNNAFNMPNGDVTVTANFSKISYAISSNVSPSGSGTVTLGSQTGTIGDVINISAVPASGYTFAGWTSTSGTIANSRSASTTFTVSSSDAIITATFEAGSADIEINFGVFPTESGTMTQSPNSETYSFGDRVTLTATPATGYRFNRWICTNGEFTDILAAETTYIVSSINDSVIAYFTQVSGGYQNAGVYNGTGYDPVAPYYYDGTNWVPVEIKRYNGSSWEDVASF